MAAGALTIRPRALWRVGPIAVTGVLLVLRAAPLAAVVALAAAVAWTDVVSCDGSTLRRRSLIGRATVHLGSIVFVDVDRRSKVGPVLIVADADDTVELARVWWAGLPALLELVLPHLFDGREWRSDLDIDPRVRQRLLDMARLRPRSAPP